MLPVGAGGVLCAFRILGAEYLCQTEFGRGTLHVALIRFLGTTS